MFRVSDKLDWTRRSRVCEVSRVWVVEESLGICSEISENLLRGVQASGMGMPMRRCQEEEVGTTFIRFLGRYLGVLGPSLLEKMFLHCCARNSYKTKRFAILHRQPLENEKFWELWTQSGPEHMTERKVFEYLHGKPLQYKCVCSFLISSHFLSFSFLLFGPDWGGTSLAEPIESNFHQTMNPTSNECLHLSSLRVRSSVFPLKNVTSLLSSLYVQQQKQIRHPKQAQTRVKKKWSDSDIRHTFSKKYFQTPEIARRVSENLIVFGVFRVKHDRSSSVWMSARHTTTWRAVFSFIFNHVFISPPLFSFCLGLASGSKIDSPRQQKKKPTSKTFLNNFSVVFIFQLFQFCHFSYFFVLLNCPLLFISLLLVFLFSFIFHFAHSLFVPFQFCLSGPCQRGDPALRAPKIDFPLKSSNIEQDLLLVFPFSVSRFSCLMFFSFSCVILRYLGIFWHVYFLFMFSSLLPCTIRSLGEKSLVIIVDEMVTHLMTLHRPDLKNKCCTCLTWREKRRHIVYALLRSHFQPPVTYFVLPTRCFVQRKCFIFTNNHNYQELERFAVHNTPSKASKTNVVAGRVSGVWNLHVLDCWVRSRPHETDKVFQKPGRNPATENRFFRHTKHVQPQKTKSLQTLQTLPAT